jgi:hypothetical protein
VQVQIIDSRPPLSIAIGLAKKTASPSLAKWQSDLAAMTVEVTRKYFGMLTDESVRDGLDACVNLLSIGLLQSTSGTLEPELWLQTLHTEGIRGVSKLAVTQIKTCDALPDYAEVFSKNEVPRPSLLLSLFAHAAKSDATQAYRYLAREIAQRTEIKRQINLAEWLLNQTPSGRTIRRDMESHFGFGGESPDADLAIHRVLFLACGCAKPKPYAESLDEDFDKIPELPVIRLAATAFAEAKQRYEELELKIPAELRPALLLHNVSWFDRFILPAKKTKAAKSPKTPDLQGSASFPQENTERQLETDWGSS